MKSKVVKTLFIISFLPYLLVLIYGIIRSFLGFPFLFTVIYGFDAFVFSIVYVLYTFTIIPVIPICLIFQVCYILKNKVKRFKNINTKKYIKVCGIIALILLSLLVINSYSYQIEKFIEKISAKQMVNNAEEKISFDENNIILDGIFDMPEYKYNHILIDYDKKEVGILLFASGDEFWKVKLQKVTKANSTYQHIINDYLMQADIPLNYPGKRLISFCEDEEHEHITIAFLLIYEDGTNYIADNIKEKGSRFNGRFTGLNASKFSIGENEKFKE